MTGKKSPERLVVFDLGATHSDLGCLGRSILSAFIQSMDYNNNNSNTCCIMLPRKHSADRNTQQQFTISSWLWLQQWKSLAT
jgi:hypothetical protein